MCAAFLPEIFFDFREIVEVIERSHSSALLGRAAMRGGLIPFPNDAQPFESEMLVHLFDVLRCAGNQRGLPAGGDYTRLFSQGGFDAPENPVDQIRIAVEKT